MTWNGRLSTISAGYPRARADGAAMIEYLAVFLAIFIISTVLAIVHFNGMK
jgi:hypothetical protein